MIEAVTINEAAQGGETTPSKRELQEAARQFEGLLVGMMLKESMQEVFSGSVTGGSSGMEMMRDLCVEKLATSLAEDASLGLADQLLEHWQLTGAYHE